MIDITFPLYYYMTYMTIRDIFIYKYGQATEIFCKQCYIFQYRFTHMHKT